MRCRERLIFLLCLPPSERTHVPENLNDSAYMGACVQYLRAATPACHLRVCVGNVVIDYRRAVVRVAVVTRRLCWLHWERSSSRGCRWRPWGVGLLIVFVAQRFVLRLNVAPRVCLPSNLSVRLTCLSCSQCISSSPRKQKMWDLKKWKDKSRTKCVDTLTKNICWYQCHRSNIFCIRGDLW